MLLELVELDVLLELEVLLELLELFGAHTCLQQFGASYTYEHPIEGVRARHGSLPSIVMATTSPPGPQSIAELLLPLLELLELELFDELLEDPPELELPELDDELELLVLLLLLLLLLLDELLVLLLLDDDELLEDELLLLLLLSDELLEELLLDELFELE